MNNPETFVFGPFRLLLPERELLSHGHPIQLGSRAFDLLLALVKRRGLIATKDDLMAEVWPGSAVEENSLHVQISALRKALGEQADGSRYLVTVPGRGYRFVAPVEQEGAPRPRTDVALTPPMLLPEMPMLLPDVPSIAVLPFTNISGDPGQDYFADGIVEDITTALCRFPSLLVISRNSSFTYKGRAFDIKQVGRELAARYVLEGSVRKAGNRVRITGHLVQTATGVQVWSDRYDGDLSDIFALQDEMTASVVGSIVPSLQQAEIERARINPPKSLDAYDLYLRALPSFYLLTREGNAQALDLVVRALELDPNFIAGVVLAANCWALQYSQGWSPTLQAQAECMRYARRAARLDKDNAEALGTLARRTAGIERDHQGAISLAEKAVALNPNSAVALRQSGYALVYCGEPEKALMYLQRAVYLSPRDPRAEDAWTGIALALIQLGQDKEAVEAGRKAVQGNPNSASTWRAFAAALAWAGQFADASAAIQRMLSIDPACTATEMKARYGYTERAADRYFEGMRKAGLPD